MYQTMIRTRVLNRFGRQDYTIAGEHVVSVNCPVHVRPTTIIVVRFFVLQISYSLQFLVWHFFCTSGAAAAADNNEDIERENFSYYEYRVG